jgi:hypothetical protein
MRLENFVALPQRRLEHQENYVAMPPGPAEAPAISAAEMDSKGNLMMPPHAP